MYKMAPKTLRLQANKVTARLLRIVGVKSDFHVGGDLAGHVGDQIKERIS